MMEAFVNEPNYTVWSDLSCNLGVLSSLLSHTDFHEDIQEFIRDLFTPIGLKLGWDSKPGEGEKPFLKGNYLFNVLKMFNVRLGVFFSLRHSVSCFPSLRALGRPVARSGAGKARESRS